MEIIAKQTYIRGGQQKLTDITRVVKKMSIAKMRLQLQQMNKHAAKRILETLNQAVANAQNNHGISEDKLVLKEMLILRGPHYKRMRPVSRGMGHAILKRTSHIYIKLESKEETESSTQPVVNSKVEETKTEEVKPVVKKVSTKKPAAAKAKAGKAE